MIHNMAVGPGPRHLAVGPGSRHLAVGPGSRHLASLKPDPGKHELRKLDKVRDKVGRCRWGFGQGEDDEGKAGVAGQREVGSTFST